MILSMAHVACTHSPEQIQGVEPSRQSNPGVNIVPTNRIPPTLTATSENPLLYIAGPLPNGLIAFENLVTGQVSADPNSPLWFGAGSEEPKGDVLYASTWIYTLAAPFPTLLDDIRQADLIDFWQGNKSNQLKNIPYIYIPDVLVPILDARWQSHDPTTIIVYEDIPESDTLWDENAWAVLPFDTLSPQLKVIRVDGISPLSKDYDSETDPLTVQYHLVKNQDVPMEIVSDQMQPILEAISSTNRHVDRMTTLVMTGVTALVRATAYRMETYGFSYPAEKIIQWLSEADLTHISNEVSFYEDCPFPDPNSTSLLFCSKPEYITLFDMIGADIIELTGNHNMDVKYVYGADVIPFTLDLYRKYGMQYYGGGLNLANASLPLRIIHHGNQLAFLGCNASGPDFAWATADQAGAAPCGDYQWIVDAIHQLAEQSYLPIVTLQYYEDYYNYAEVHHIRDFSLVAEAGAVIVNGSQAHRPKGMTFIGNAFVHYGLGNLFFDQMGVVVNGGQISQTRWEIIQRHTFYDNHLLSIELLTAMLEDYAQPRPMTAGERMMFLEELFSASGWVSR